MRLNKPVVLISIPKSGTNLVLKFLSQYRNYEKVSPKFGFTSSSVDLYGLEKFISNMESGDVYWSHLTYSRERARLLKEIGVAVIFLYRDPRDILCSMAHYYGNKSKRLNPYTDYLGDNDNIQSKIEKLITGNSNGRNVETGKIPSFINYLKNYTGWMKEDSFICKISFEGIINRERRYQTLKNIQDHADGKNWFLLLKSYLFGIPKTTRTFRKGESGGYSKVFDHHLNRLYENGKDVYEMFENRI